MIILSFILTGCWDLSEVETLDMISLIGVDMADNGGIKVILQELAPLKQQKGGLVGGGGAADQKPFHTYTETGATVYETIQSFSNKTAISRLFFAHLRAVIISEKLARSKGIEDIMDFLLRNPEIRRRVWILIAREGEFDRIMNTDFGLGIHTGRIIDEMILNKRLNLLQPVTNLNDFVRVVENPGNEPFTAGISMVKKKNVEETKKSGDKEDKPEKYDLQISDAAVFHRLKMTGWLDDMETRGLLWARGEIKGGTFTINSGGNDLSMNVVRMNSVIKPVILNGEMQINIMVNVRTRIAESKEDLDYSKNEIINKIQNLQNEEIKREIMKAIEKSRELDADIFQFGGRIFDQYPKYWLEIADHWDDFYKSLPVVIDVKSTIEQTGLIKKSGFRQKTYRKG